MPGEEQETASGLLVGIASSLLGHKAVSQLLK